MAIDYTIAAIPTTYNGRRYRSRLEARWAAYFDLLGFQFEYEPCDFGLWSPDFAIWTVKPEYPIYVEVKPIDQWDRETARKMADTCKNDERILLVGKGPQCDGKWDVLGYLAETQPFGYEARWSEALLCQDGLGRYDFRHNDLREIQDTWLFGALSGFGPSTTDALWKQAANIVQWHPKDKNK